MDNGAWLLMFIPLWFLLLLPATYEDEDYYEDSAPYAVVQTVR